MTARPLPAQWWEFAACRSADPELFFPISSAGPSVVDVARAKTVCEQCAVQRDCLSFALTTNQTYGVWGGMTEQERQRLRQRAGSGQVVGAAQSKN